MHKVQYPEKIISGSQTLFQFEKCIQHVGKQTFMTCSGTAVISLPLNLFSTVIVQHILSYFIRLGWYFTRKFTGFLHGIFRRVFCSIFYNLWLRQDLARGWQALWWFSSRHRSTARFKSFFISGNEITIVQCGRRRWARSYIDVQVSLENVISSFRRLKRETNICKFVCLEKLLVEQEWLI